VRGRDLPKSFYRIEIYFRPFQAKDRQQEVLIDKLVSGRASCPLHHSRAVAAAGQHASD
jgi:hypothetical protein